MTTPFEISDRLTEAYADANPFAATYHGIGGRDHLSTDMSPDGHAGRADLFRGVRGEIGEHLEHDDPDQAFAAQVLTRWLDERIAEYDSAKWRRDLNHIVSPFQNVLGAFDVMPRETPADWDNYVARLNDFGATLDGYRHCLQLGIDADDTVAVRQAESLLEQVEVTASEESRLLAFVEQAKSVGADIDAVSAAVDVARAACSEFATFLREMYIPAARTSDSVGAEEYLRGADEFLGMTIDLDETYQWGWSEVHRIRDEMRSTAAEIDPDATVEEVIELLQTDPARAAATRGDFVEFISGIQQDAIGKLAGEHFEVPEPLRTVTVSIAPPGGSLGAWYVSPSEDFSRPGSIWYAPGEREFLPHWQEVSTAYHEGFPGHHLQVGTAVLQRKKLSRFHRSVIWYSGSGEGWALYAERLMDELGFFEKPEYRLGLLASQLFRSVRIVVDIGCQLQYRIPDNAPIHAGELWEYERAVDYMNLVGLQARDISESEVKRYLGWYGQAISYKVGEREIMAMRKRARAKPGYDQKDFHARLLEASAIRLDQLHEVMG